MGTGHSQCQGNCCEVSLYAQACLIPEASVIEWLRLQITLMAHTVKMDITNSTDISHNHVTQSITHWLGLKKQQRHVLIFEQRQCLERVQKQRQH